MKIFINGEVTNIDTQQSPCVADALATFLKKEQQELTYAVALNSSFVSKENYATTPLTEQDTLDILFPIVGG